MVIFASAKFKTVGAFRIIIHQNLTHNIYVLAEYMKGIITMSDTTDAIFKLDGKIHFHDQDTVRISSMSKMFMVFPSAACICAGRIKAVTRKKNRQG